MIGHRLQVVGIMIHVMSAERLRRATMSAPVGSNDAISFAEEKKHLRVPIIRRERPAVAEHNGLSAAPVFVIDVDVLSIFFSSSYIWHKRFPFSSGCTKRCATHGRVNIPVILVLRRGSGQCYVCVTIGCLRKNRRKQRPRS